MKIKEQIEQLTGKELTSYSPTSIIAFVLLVIGICVKQVDWLEAIIFMLLIINMQLAVSPGQPENNMDDDI